MRKAVSITIILLLFFFLSRSGKTDQLAIQISRNYHYADSLFNLDSPTDQTDSSARQSFDLVISLFRDSSRTPDTFLFNSLWKNGVLEEVRGHYTRAKWGYLGAINVSKQILNFDDSLNFKPLLYAGGIYYRENQFDSTRILLERAESLADKYKLTEEVGRLYNTLGALYFEGGNFLQSKNYLEKALQVIEKKPLSDSVEKINFKLNIASALVKLERFDEALSSYQSLLRSKKFTDTIYLNIGTIYMAKGQYEEALKYYRYSSAVNHAPGLLNEIADAHLMLKQYDSALFYLNLSAKKMKDGIQPMNKRFIGIYHLYKGDYYGELGQLNDAIFEYQNAIVTLENDFTDTSIYSNPTNFWGTFSSYMLFRALMRKATCFEKLYAESSDIKFKKAALDAYLSAIDLAIYLEKSMDTDEARIFLKKNINSAYHKAVDLSIELYNKTGEDSLLWIAYSISERNKSSVLVANLQEFSIKNQSKVPDSLLQNERNLKYQIARLQIQADQLPDSLNAMELAMDKRNAELELASIQKKIRQFLDESQVQGPEEAYSKSNFLKDKLSAKQAILDFYFSDSILHIFGITNNEIKHYSLPTNELNWIKIKAIQKSLYDMEDGQERMYETVTTQLFDQVINPVFETIKSKKEWIVLPDGPFYYLPFEILTDPSTFRMLIEDYAISYNFSTEFISNNATKPLEPENHDLFAMAPFCNQGLYAADDSNSLEQLPATALEIGNLNGTVLMDSLATKSSFIRNANNYSILHLATHAVMNADKPSQSFIAFYPTDTTKPESFKLYLNELYGLNLDSTRLMLLSACETGIGKFVQGEGVMSLSRGVLYAGCPSVITTLWRADDKATAFIVMRFHEYLKKGEDITMALRLAKLDLMKQYPSTIKNPSLWAHLILVGQVNPLYYSYTSFWLKIGLGIILLTGIITLILIRKSAKVKTRI